MTISIITPVYNDTRVKYSQDSLWEQKLEDDIQSIVVDGGSTDGTLEILENYRSRIDVLISEPDRGIYDAMNKGIARARGDVVGILNADDRYQDSHVLRDVLAEFESPEVDACYGDLVHVDQDNRVVRYWRSGRYQPYKSYLGWMPPHPTFFVRKSIYERYGIFNTDLSIAADYELMLRFLLKHRIKTTYINRIMVRMGTGGASGASVGGVLKANKEVLRAWRVNQLKFGYIVPILKPVQKITQFIQRPN